VQKLKQKQDNSKEEVSMSKMTLRSIAVVAVVATALGQNLLATTSVAVGPSTCQPSLVHFSTIQAAVNAVPFNTTILVCPGTYPEQVVISQPLTLRGVVQGTSGAAVIAVPAGGLVLNANTTLWGPSTAQLLVQNTVGVNVSDITIDGTGSGCVLGAGRTLGIEYHNVGIPIDGTAAGKIQNVVVRNQQDGCGFLVGEGGEGILSDTSFITITANEVHDIDRSGIITYAGQNSITSNSVQNTENGIVAVNATTQTLVSQNAISNLTSTEGFTTIGAWVDGGAAKITLNTIASSTVFGYGIFSEFSAGTVATGNKVNAVTYGVTLFVTSGNIVGTNTINKTHLGLYDTSSNGGNVITKNTVNEADFGVFTDSTVGGDTLVPNNLYNVVVTVDPSEITDPTVNTAP
jgi:Periplasmic copper-binding protein (NosD)